MPLFIMGIGLLKGLIRSAEVFWGGLEVPNDMDSPGRKELEGPFGGAHGFPASSPPPGL